jgi:uroporphyrinogen decarboxylase
MTNRELFLAFARFMPVPRIPRRASYTPPLAERLKQELGMEIHHRYPSDADVGPGLTPPAGYRPPDYTPYFPDYVGKPGFTIDGNGCGHLSHGYYHFTEYISPLRKASDFRELEQFPIPDRSTWSDTALRVAVRKAHEEGRQASVFLGHMYETAWQIRGYEPFLEDLLVRREWAEYLLDRIAANNRVSAIAAARAGCDAIWCGDDIANQNAMMFHPDLWRAVMKPRWASVFEAARSIKPDILIWYHSDGNVSAVLDDLIEIGVSILNPVQPECMNPVEIRKRYGQRLAFDGCVGTQTTMPFGTPADVKRVVRELVEALDGYHGGLMLSPTHVLEPEVPTANILAFFEACDNPLD